MTLSFINVTIFNIERWSINLLDELYQKVVMFRGATMLSIGMAHLTFFTSDLQPVILTASGISDSTRNIKIILFDM